MTTRAAKWYEIPIVGNDEAEKARLAKLDEITKKREARRIRTIAKLFPEKLPSIIQSLPENHPDRKRLLDQKPNNVLYYRKEEDGKYWLDFNEDGRFGIPFSTKEQMRSAIVSEFDLVEVEV